jgi:exonuclease III
MHVIKISKLNINRITAQTSVGMLSEFITRYEIDIMLFQEVTNPDTLNIRGYVTHHNIGTSMRGTAILARKEMPITIVHKLPSGRAMSAEYSGISFIKVYAPSGSARRTEREIFFNNELPFAFLTAAPHTILAGDFNCVLNPADNTGALQPSRALLEIVRNLSLVDTWNQDPLRPNFTHHSPTGATRIDRIYVSSELAKRKSGVEIIPAAFTDHHALVLRLAIEDKVVRRRLRRWKMDPTLMHDDAIKRKIRDTWIQWRNRKRHYPDVSMWWESCAKKELRRLMRSDDIERKINFRHMENHLYEFLYDIIRSAVPEMDKFLELKQYKTKLVQLHAMRREKIMLDTSDYDKMDDEEPSLYHLLKTLRRRDTEQSYRCRNRSETS